jgi:hypothetical protein
MEIIKIHFHFISYLTDVYLNFDCDWMDFLEIVKKIDNFRSVFRTELFEPYETYVMVRINGEGTLSEAVEQVTLWLADLEEELNAHSL